MDPEDPDSKLVEHELVSQGTHIREVILVTALFLTIAAIMHFLLENLLESGHVYKSTGGHGLSDAARAVVAEAHARRLQTELKLHLLREILSGLIAVLVTFVVTILFRLRTISSTQAAILRRTQNLDQKFTDMQSRDNIIVPSGTNYRVMSVANLDKLPDPIGDVWARVFDTQIELNSQPPDQTRRLYGCAILFWASIDDVINSPDYIRYFSATTNTADFFRVLVTTKPKHTEGLRVYLELARHFSSAVYIIDHDKWNSEICRLFLRSPGLERKRKILDLLQSQIEIVSERPISEFSVQNDKWLVRHLKPEPGRSNRDQRARLAQSDIVTFSSSDERDPARNDQIEAVSRFLTAISTSGSYRDATKDGEIDAIFATALPDKVRRVIEDFGAQVGTR